MAGAQAESPAAGPALGFAPPLQPARGSARTVEPAGAAGVPARGLWLATLLFAALLCALTFFAKGGLKAEQMTAPEMALTIGSGIVLAAAALVLPADTRRDGVWAACLLIAFALLSAVSIIWSVQPDGSWRDANRLLAYGAVFAATLAVVRAAPRLWPALLGGMVLSAVVVCGYALLTKSLPEHFPEANHYARLYEPFGYWNALGLTAAMGAIGCLWLGARRAGHGLLSALAYPAMGLLLLTLLLAYSRGSLLALAVGVVLWLWLVPLRLRGAAVLVAGLAAAGPIAAWDFGDHALSAEGVPLAEAAAEGHELGVLTIAMVVLLTAVGMAVVFATGRRAPSPELRRRAGAVLLGLVGLAVLAFLAALARSRRGFTGTISHALHSLTNTHASVPNTPGRLTAIASVRAQYWSEALKVFRAHPALGVGAGGYEVARLRYRTGPLPVKHAHGFVVQTMADLGIVGLALALALLLVWMAAAGRSTHPFDRRWRSWRELRGGARPAWERLPEGPQRRYCPERIGLLTMLCAVVVFGLHSLYDWTWYVPANAVLALICAAWVAGRGPLQQAAPGGGGTAPAGGLPWREGRRPQPWRIGLACAVLAAALLAAWSQWQPQRSEDAREEAIAAAATNPLAARADAQRAVSRDPLSAEALFTLAAVQATSGQVPQARATLRRAVRLQPSNPQTWLALGEFDLAHSAPAAAVHELRAGIYLDPELIRPEALVPGRPGQAEAVGVYNDYVEALRRSAQQAAVSSASARRSRAARDARRAALRRRARRAARSRSRR